MCYIPLQQAKRERSAEILAEVAARFGYPPLDIADEITSWFADGGVVQ